MIKNAIFLFVFCFPVLSFANSLIKVVNVLSVYDGDTFRADLNGYPSILSKNIPIRIRGIDAPEIRGKCDFEKDLAVRARDYLKAALVSGSVTLKEVGRGKYFRLVADVFVDGVDVGGELIRLGLARRYDGKTTRYGWCS